MNLKLINEIDNRGWKHLWVAKRIGVTTSRFSLIVRGRVNPTLDEKKQLCELLSKKEDELLKKSGSASA